MAQANSVQREPSMEEILASIRRIIEDSDTTRPANDVAASEAGQSGFAQRSAARSAEKPSAPVETATESWISSKPARETESDETRNRRIAAELRPSLAAFSAEKPASQLSEPVEETVGSAAPEPESPAKPEQTSAASPSILSEKAGREVAAAFGELSEAVASSRQKDLDDMAERMLRPMLTQWLDTNLPALVERLVREEIQRITTPQPR